jgi:hypothetical protein
VNDGTAGKVGHAKLLQESAAPDPMAYDRINQKCQEKGKNDKRNVLDSFRHRSRHDRCGGSAEYELKEELRQNGIPVHDIAEYTP